MNKKFTMMLAAFVAAGYTITAEAGVVKVSKPVNGGTYYITNVDGKLAMTAPDAVDNTAKVVDVTNGLESVNPQIWTVDIPSEGKIRIGYNATNDYGINADGFKIKQNGASDLIFSDNKVYADASKSWSMNFPASAGSMVSTQNNDATAELAFYIQTSVISGNNLSNAPLKIGDKYVVVVKNGENYEVKAYSALEYSKMEVPTTWTADSNGKISTNVSALKADGDKYLKIDATGATLVDSDTEATVFELAKNGTAEAKLVTEDTQGKILFISSDLKAVETTYENAPVSETDETVANLTLTAFTGTVVDGAIEGGLSDKTYSRLVAYTANSSSSDEKWLKGANGSVSYEDGTDTDDKGYYWKLNSDGTITDANENSNTLTVASTQKFQVVKVDSNSEIFYLYANGQYVKWNTSKLEFTTSPSEATPFSAVEEKVTDITSITTLNGIVQGEFSLKFEVDGKEVTDHLFKNVTAIQVEESTDTYTDGTYFVLNAPANLAVNSAITDKAVLDELTFIAISPVKVSASEGEFVYDEVGAGYKLVTVAGKNMVSATTTAGKINYSNAAFVVSQKELNKDALQIRPTDGGFYVNNEDADALVNVSNSTAELVIAAVKGSKDALFVSTVNKNSDAVHNSFATLSSDNVVKYSDFLGETAKIFNIKFVSMTAAPTTGTDAEKQAKSEYMKYLGVGEVTTNLLVQGAEFVDLSLPQNQWVVSGMTTDNVVTFTNRELGNSFSAKLVKTEKANQYRLAGFALTSSPTLSYLYKDSDGKKKIESISSPSTNSFVVELTPATVTNNDGYVYGDLSTNDFVKIAFAPTSSMIVDNLYLNVDKNSSYATTLKKETAAEFEVVKTEQPSTAWHTTSFAILNEDGKPEVNSEVADTLKLTTYAFKYDGKYLKDDMTSANETSAANFVIKKLNNGKLALVFADAFSDITTNPQIITYFDADLDEGKVKAGNNIYEATDDAAAYISFVGENAHVTLPAKSQHVLFNNEGAYMAVNENNAAVIDGPSELKAEYTKEQLTFWLDTTNSEQNLPAFYITKGSKEFMFNAVDSLSRFNEGTASAEEVKAYQMPDDEAAARAIFRAATLKDSDTLTTSINGESKDLTADNGIEAYQFNIFLKDDAVADEYVVRSVKNGYYLYESNGAVGFTDDSKQAIVFTIESTEAPTSNEGVSASDVKVVAQNGSVVVMNAAGKNVVVSTILGQVVVNEVLTSDNAIISVPAGIVVVAVEGESFKVNVK